ncbi:hypothetical protein METH_10745 [Leisingera methylohalidivorans DSM 14336]|uniref:Uncharacterized protein n=1 Tax=Leisingera methylohalidivorans DSM 14336 TaxID=999552 RepID=V9VYP7_9RHOB|nr:hypothetical protein METH_10745 [Leisingera methylohalidivorans DSM 14336]
MDCIAVLDLGNGRRIHCKSVDAAKARWAETYSGMEEATIDVLFPIGLSSIVVTYRYDSDMEKWVKCS